MMSKFIGTNPKKLETAYKEEAKLPTVFSHLTQESEVMKFKKLGWGYVMLYCS